MSQFLERIENSVGQRQLLVSGQKILVAVSGGVDSMVLLHTLRALAVKNQWEISVAHFNHRLRGRASEADEELVRQAAAALGLPFFSDGADVKRIAERSKISIEMASRKLRHEFLARQARANSISTIALAHHADDQVELFFVRLLRGTGGEGLGGMKWRSPSPAEKTIFLVRPLLDFSKAELTAYARENKIQYRNDATNFSSDFLRNRIRNELLPLLRENYQPGLDRTVLRVMDIVGAEAEYVGRAAREFYNTPEMPHGAPVHFDSLPVAIQRKVLQQQLTSLALLPDFELVEQLRLTPGKKMNVCSGLSVSRDLAGVVACREDVVIEFDPAEHTLKLSGTEGRAEFGGHKFVWSVEAMGAMQALRKKSASKPQSCREFFDADKIGDEIVLRHWRPGDRFQPIGMKSEAKLQDLFVNAKIPAARRRELVLAATQAGQIFWVEGLRISEEFKLTSATRRKLDWQARFRNQSWPQ